MSDQFEYVIAGTLALSLLCVSCAATPKETSSSPPANVEKTSTTCTAWHALDPKQRFLVVGSALQNQVGRPETSPLADCLWAISDQIAQHTVDLCTTGRSYSEAIGLAFSTAIEFCQSKR